MQCLQSGFDTSRWYVDGCWEYCGIINYSLTQDFLSVFSQPWQVSPLQIQSNNNNETNMMVNMLCACQHFKQPSHEHFPWCYHPAGMGNPPTSASNSHDFQSTQFLTRFWVSTSFCCGNLIFHFMETSLKPKNVSCIVGPSSFSHATGKSSCSKISINVCTELAYWVEYAGSNSIKSST